jgi:hypothetical protein
MDISLRWSVTTRRELMVKRCVFNMRIYLRPGPSGASAAVSTSDAVPSCSPASESKLTCPMRTGCSACTCSPSG